MHTPPDAEAASYSSLLCRFEKTSLSGRADDGVLFVATPLRALWRLTLGKRISNGFQTDKMADIRRANAYNGYLDFRLLVAGVLGPRCRCRRTAPGARPHVARARPRVVEHRAAGRGPAGGAGRRAARRGVVLVTGTPVAGTAVVGARAPGGALTLVDVRRVR